MTKWEIIHRISSWQKKKWDTNHLAVLMDKCNANNLREVTQEQAQTYYNEHKTQYHESEELQYGR